MSSSETILGLTRDALALIEAPSSRLSGAARKALRVARLGVYPIATFSIQYDFVSPSMTSQVQDLLRDLKKSYSAEKANEIYKHVNGRYNEERKYYELNTETLKQEVSYCFYPLDNLEDQIDFLSRSINYDTKALDKLTVIFRRRLQEYQTILSRIRQRIYSFLVSVEQRYEMGEITQDIFTAYRVQVDKVLATVAPDVLEKFNSVYRRISDGDTEALSQALTSCRRILKAIADAVYPPISREAVGPEPVTHVLTEDKFINRLYQFVGESSGSESETAILRAQLGDVETRLKALNGLSSKGTHSEIGSAEARQCAIQTYLVAGDILRLYHRKQPQNSSAREI